MTNVVMSLGVQLLPSTQRSRQSLIMRRQSPVTAILGHTLYLGHLEIQIFSSEHTEIVTFEGMPHTVDCFVSRPCIQDL